MNTFQPKVNKLLAFTRELQELKDQKMIELEMILKDFTYEDLKEPYLAWDIETYANNASNSLGEKCYVHVSPDGVSFTHWVPSSMEC